MPQITDVEEIKLFLIQLQLQKFTTIYKNYLKVSIIENKKRVRLLSHTLFSE